MKYLCGEDELYCRFIVAAGVFVGFVLPVLLVAINYMIDFAANHVARLVKVTR